MNAAGTIAALVIALEGVSPLQAHAQSLDVPSAMGAFSEPRTRRERDPTEAYQAGIVALNFRDYPQAVRELQVASELYGRDPTFNFALGIALYGDGRYRAARDQLERAVSQENPPASAHFYLGLAHVELGDLDAARGQRRALSRKLSACRSRCNEYERERTETALRVLTEAIGAS